MDTHGHRVNLLPDYKRPALRIRLDGEDITTRLEDRLISLTIRDNRGFEADQIDLVIDDSDGKLDIPERGAELAIAIGWADADLVDKGTFIVDEIEHSGAPDILSLRARSAELRGGLSTQRERSWHDTTVGAIVRAIADECDLLPSIDDLLSVQKVVHLDQTAESGANLLTRLARDHDAIASVKNGKLLFIPAAAGLSASGKPLPSITIERKSGDRHHFAIADRDSCTAVRAYYHDLATGIKGEEIWSAVEDANESKKPLPTPPTLSGKYKELGKTYKSRSAALRGTKAEWKRIKANKTARETYVGALAKYNDTNVGVLGEVAYGKAEEDQKRSNARKLAQRDAEKIDPTLVKAIDHSADDVKTLRHPYASKENAKRAARAEWRRQQRGLANFSISLCLGRPDLFPELPATVRGFKPQIDNTGWIINRVTHTLNESGYTTDLHLEMQSAPPLPLLDIQGVQFDFDKSNLRQDAYPILDKAAATLIEYPDIHVEVGGHTDNVGSQAYNQKLSLARARSVMNYLVTKGVAAARLTAVGYGVTRPIASNATEAGRAKNRRVELKVVSG